MARHVPRARKQPYTSIGKVPVQNWARRPSPADTGSSRPRVKRQVSVDKAHHWAEDRNALGRVLGVQGLSLVVTRAAPSMRLSALSRCGSAALTARAKASTSSALRELIAQTVAGSARATAEFSRISALVRLPLATRTVRIASRGMTSRIPARSSWTVSRSRCAVPPLPRNIVPAAGSASLTAMTGSPQLSTDVVYKGVGVTVSATAAPWSRGRPRPGSCRPD